MRISGLQQKLLLLATCVLFHLAVTAQVRIQGTIYERTGSFGMAGVSVRSTSGAGAVTDSLGHYSIWLPLSDSISFSYQGKFTQKFPVREIRRGYEFDMRLHVDVHVLPLVDVKEKSYRLDSIENRNEYRKVFDYEREYFSSGNVGPAVGFNLDLLFNIRKMKRMEHFRKQLEEQEREKYVTHRFNRVLVGRLTKLQPPALDTFMIEYRPTYEQLMNFETEYEYQKYIKEWGAYFSEQWKREHQH
ncbi:peptidase associated/transthyretin-like domain-containing protein [Chitinophaga tropicalis]|uniref:Carboxypeptidase-like regulatory domain-containing protein n=1 Tax=Chitinophaga tropicalis TaxID=2683588 RepID=A0A7K1U263_9BACT|nr:hypothetical protein [Chitinophaga tropicalis]MVT08447.1 hypothetical protein [Chitinophaga tropicalis]